MSDDFHSPSRVNRFEKRRKGTKAITFLLIAGGILILVLIGFFLFGGGDEDNATNNNENQEVSPEKEQDSAAEVGEDDKNENEDTADGANQPDSETSEEEETEPNENDTGQEAEKETVDSSGDSNVKEAYTADWKPVGTKQQGTHQTTFEEGTQDWEEMMEAIELATDLPSSNRVVWWVERGSADQQVIATVSDSDETETYRTYLTWVENEGWKPTKVEVLKENDQKYRFEQ